MRSETGNPAIRLVRAAIVAVLALATAFAVVIGAPQASSAQSETAGSTDSLWVASFANLGVCASPSSAQSLSSCFQTPVPLTQTTAAIATDGTNVYIASQISGGYSCPIADLGANCTRIMAGPWPSYNNNDNEVTSLAAADGYLFIGQKSGQIYRCPSDLPYVDQSSMPSQCIEFSSGSQAVQSLLLANNNLYVGVSPDGKSTQAQLWSCDPQTADSCSVIDSMGYQTYPASLAAGGGNLWAGLGSGILWKCPAPGENNCSNYDTAGKGQALNSLSYDSQGSNGQATVYAAVAKSSGQTNNGVIWQCPVASANDCNNLLTKVSIGAVAGGDSNVFSSDGYSLYYGTSKYTNASTNSGYGWSEASMLYIPASGVTGVGAVSVKSNPRKLRRLVKARCAAGAPRRARLSITGPSGFHHATRVPVCGSGKAGVRTWKLDLLDTGKYRLKARIRGGKTLSKKVMVRADRTTKARLG